MDEKRFTGTIEVMGRAEAMAPPDEARVMLEIVTEAETAEEAVASNAETTQAVIDAVMAEPNDGVTTTGLGVYPIYAYDPQTNSSSIRGYRARNGVQVVTDPDNAGRMFDVGIAAGANVGSGISFGLSDPEPLREQALRDAIAMAQREAEVVAEATGIELLGPEAIVVDPLAAPIPFRAELAADAAVSPTMPGDVAIQVAVRLRYRTMIG